MTETPARKLTVGGVLFPHFELLDIFGPLELFGLLTEHAEITMLGATAGQVLSAQGPSAVIDVAFADAPPIDILLIPGGYGARACVEDPTFLEHIRGLSAQAQITASICTGSAILARAGLLDGLRATSNKLSFDWVASQGPRVHWERRARWVEDGQIFTASGVSAGMDMALGLIDRLWGRDTALLAAHEAEYLWNENRDDDPFAIEPTP